MESLTSSTRGRTSRESEDERFDPSSRRKLALGVGFISAFIGWICAFTALTMNDYWGLVTQPGNSAAIVFGGTTIFLVVLLGWCVPLARRHCDILC